MDIFSTVEVEYIFSYTAENDMKLCVVKKHFRNNKSVIMKINNEDHHRYYHVYDNTKESCTSSKAMCVTMETDEIKTFTSIIAGMEVAEQYFRKVTINKSLILLTSSLR